MRRVTALLLVIVMCALLGACNTEKEPQQDSQKPNVKIQSTGKNAPSESLIIEDLKKALQSKNENAILTGAETVKSLTDENRYSTTLHVTAKTKYANWTYEATLSYTKYDQG